MQMRGGVVAARVLAVAGALFWGILWFGLIDLLVVVLQDERFHEDYLFESGWGLLYLLLVTVPLVVLAVRPGAAVALAQLAVVTLAVLLGALWAGALPQLWTGLGLALTVAVLAVVGRGSLVEWRAPDPVQALLAAVALPAAVRYGAPLARETPVLPEMTNGVSHDPMQASLALAVVGLVGLAAMTRSRLPAWTTGFTVLWLGVESLVYPELRGSLGTVGGALAVAYGVLVLGAVARARRRTGEVPREPVAAAR